jgi:hypothetical protein
LYFSYGYELIMHAANDDGIYIVFQTIGKSLMKAEAKKRLF